MSIYPQARVPRAVQTALRPLVEAIIRDYQVQLTQQQITCEIDIDSELTGLVDSHLLTTALQHLVADALASLPAGGELTVTAVRTLAGIELEVADSRPDCAVEPSSAVPILGRGTFAVVQQAARAHGGSLDVCACPQGGVAVTLLVPQRTLRAAA